jgi:predicted alpha/beta superfamily hydrolase
MVRNTMQHRHAHVRRALTALLALALADGAGAQAQAGQSVSLAPPAATTTWPRALLPDTQSFVLETGAHGPRYRVWLYQPAVAPGPRSQPRAEGEAADAPARDTAPPLLVLLDGNATFTLAVSAARLQERLIGPVVIAAIAADNDALFDERQRFRDFTTPNRDGWGVPRGAQGQPVETGGAQAFEEVVNGTLPQAIEARVRVSPHKRMLFGHSLGGFFVLHDALAHPGAYSRYMAASPSLWWNAGELLARVRADAAAARGRPATGGIPLAIRVGGDEQRIATDAPPARIERVTHAAMIDNARALSDLLNGSPALGFDADMQIYPGQNHVSYLPAAISEAVKQASGQTSGQTQALIP